MAKGPVLSSVIDLLASQPILLLFVVAALGYPLGRVKVLGVSFGVAMVLFAALAIGAIDQRLRLPEVFGQIGLVLFVYTIGLASGSSFFSAFKKDGIKTVLLVWFGLAVAALITVFGAHFLGLSAPTAAGGFTGALTNTPALAGVVQALAEAQKGMPVVGYSIAYPMGVLGVILAQIAFWKWAPERQADHEVKALKRPLKSQTVLVTNPAVDGLSIHDLRSQHTVKVLLGRYRRDGKIALSDASTRLKLGDEVNVVGAEDEVLRAIGLLGELGEEDLTLDRSVYDYRRIFVSNPAVLGRTLSDLRLPQDHGAIITRVRRGDLDFIPEATTILQPGDRVRVVADASRLQDLTKFFGDSYSRLSEIDVMSFSLGIAAGTLIGLIPIPLPGGLTVSLGLAGGPLVVSLILGSLHRTGPILWELPYSANLTLRQLGLILFFATVGTRAGFDFWQTLQTSTGLVMFGLFALVTLATSFSFLLAARMVFPVSKATILGMAAGIHTQPAALTFALDHTKNDQANLGYATAFPVASISKIILAQILLSLIGKA